MSSKFNDSLSGSPGFSLNVLTDDDLDAIHRATLEVLEQTGLFVETREALDVFDGAGADIDRKNKIVKIPPNVVEDAIRSAPSKILLAGRDPENDRLLEVDRVLFTNFSEGVEVIDPYSGERRIPTKADLANAAKMVDYLDNIDVCEKAVGANDVSPKTVPLHNAEAMLSHTTKHCCVGPGDGFLLRKLVQMAAAIVGGLKKLKKRPILSFTTCPVSPLQLIRECCEIIMESARTGSVINILSMAMAGGTAPVSLAGALVTHNAEVLGGITLNQLVAKGAPVIYGSSTTAMDLKLGAASVGTPECAVISAAVARLARYYALPSYVAGGQSDAKISDTQMGHEKTLTGLMAALAGANLIYGPGMRESGITFDFAQLVLDNEFARMIKHTIRGFRVDKENLAVDVIKEIGPANNFLMHAHTLRHMRTQSQPELIDRRGIEDWKAAGGTDIYQRAAEKAKYILEHHKPDPLRNDVSAEIRSIISETEDELGVSSDK